MEDEEAGDAESFESELRRNAEIAELKSSKGLDLLY
jgi:hypothetical protein